MTNPEQEAESIRFGFADINDKSLRALREVAICQINGRDISGETKARLISIEEEAQALRVRKAALDGTDVPQRPVWLDLAPSDDQ